MWISNEGAALFSFAVADNNSELDEKITIFAGYIVYKILKNYIKITKNWLLNGQMIFIMKIKKYVEFYAKK